MDALKSLSPHVHWLLRLSVAATFAVHGLSKFPPDGFASFTGLPLAVAWLVALSEVAAAVALIVGAFRMDVLTRIGGLLVSAIMIGAIILVHAKNGWDVNNGGMEFQALMLAVGVYFLVRGNDT